MNENPYGSPAQPAPMPMPEGALTLGKATVYVVVTTIVCGIVGLGIGVLLGAFVPGYYRSVFAADIDPLSVGIGLGLAQGLAAGLFVGVGIVASVAWYQSRIRRQYYD